MKTITLTILLSFLSFDLIHAAPPLHGTVGNHQVAFGNGGNSVIGSPNFLWNNGATILTWGQYIQLHARSLFDVDNDLNLINAQSTGFQDKILFGDDHAITAIHGAGTFVFGTGWVILHTDPGGYIRLEGGPVSISNVLSLDPIPRPDSPTSGMVYHDLDNHLYFYNGSDWKQLDN